MKISEFSDSFDAAGFDWYSWESHTYWDAPGVIRLEPAVGSVTYAGFQRDAIYDLTNSEMFIELVDAGDQSLVSWEAQPVFLQNQNTMVNVRIVVTNNQVGVSTTGLPWSDFIPYDPVQHRYFKVREAAGTTYFESSPDTETWTTFWSQATSSLIDFTPTTVRPGMSAGTWQVESAPTRMIVDNYNVLLPVTHGRPKIWNGTAWARKPAKVWNGVAWVEKPLKVRAPGATWKMVN